MTCGHHVCNLCFYDTVTAMNTAHRIIIHGGSPPHIPILRTKWCLTCHPICRPADGRTLHAVECVEVERYQTSPIGHQRNDTGHTRSHTPNDTECPVTPPSARATAPPPTPDTEQRTGSGRPEPRATPPPSCPPSPAAHDAEQAHDGAADNRQRRIDSRAAARAARLNEDFATAATPDQNTESVSPLERSRDTIIAEYSRLHDIPTIVRDNPVFVVMDIYWNDGMWHQGHPSHQRRLARAYSARLPAPPPLAHGSFQSFLPEQPASLPAYAAHLSEHYEDLRDLDVWHTAEGWRIHGHDGELLPEDMPAPPHAGQYIGPLLLTEAAQHHQNTLINPDGHNPHTRDAPHPPDQHNRDSPIADEDRSDDDDSDDGDNEYQTPAPPTRQDSTTTEVRTVPPTRPPQPVQTTIPETQQRWSRTDKAKAAFQCIIAGCPDQNPTFDSRGKLGEHFRSARHKPVTGIPTAALAPFGIYRCSHGCPQIWCRLGLAEGHEKTCPRNPASPTHPDAHRPLPHATTAQTDQEQGQAAPGPAPRADISNQDIPYESIIPNNRAHLDKLVAERDQLMHIQNNTLPYIPNAANIYVTSMYREVFTAANKNLDSERPTVMLAAIPRYIFAPPHPDDTVSNMPQRIAERIMGLANGGGEELWNTWRWDQGTPATTAIRTVTPDMRERIVTSSLTGQTPARLFRRLSAIPFLPPTRKVASILESKITSTPNPHQEELQRIAQRYLPRPPYGRVVTADTEAAKNVTRKWSGVLDSSNPTGAPDGTGFRFSHLKPLTLAHPAFAKWIDAISQHKRNTFLVWWHLTRTLAGQCKTDEHGNYPSTADEAVSARPISRMSIIRRLMAKHFSPMVCKALRPLLEPHGQFGLSPSGCPAIHRSAQMHHDFDPEWPHAPLDIQNAHSTIERKPTVELLITTVESNPHDHRHLIHLLWNLAHYAFGPSEVFIQTDDPDHQPFKRRFITDALDQGDGMATPTFDLAFTIYTVARLTGYFPPKSFTRLLCHDDTTLIAPLVRPPPDDPKFARLKTIPRDTLAQIIRSYATCGVPPLVQARYFTTITSTVSPPAPHPAMSLMAQYAIPHLPLITSAFAQLSDESIGLKLAPGKKMRFYQRPQPKGTLTAIYRSTDQDTCIWHPTLPDGLTFDHDSYKLAGAHIGTPEAIHKSILKDVARWIELLHHIVNIPGAPIYPLYIAIKTAFTPMSKFGHHFSAHPPTVVERLAEMTRHHLAERLQTLFGFAPEEFTKSPEEKQVYLRFFTTAAHGGCGVSDPTTDRHSAYPANFISTLPLMLQVPLHEARLNNTRTWATSISGTLKEASAALANIRDVIEHTVTPSRLQTEHRMTTTMIAKALTTPTDTTAYLAAVAKRSLQRLFTDLLHGDRVRRLAQNLPTYQSIAFQGSSKRGAAPLLNITRIITDHALNNNAAQFLIGHRMAIRLPYLRGVPYCHPRCKGVPHPPSQMNATHPLRHALPHGYHQINCPLYSLMKTRHDKWVDHLTTTLRTRGAMVAIAGHHLRTGVTSRKTVDIRVIHVDRQDVWPINIDPSFSVPFLPAYAAKAAEDFDAYMQSREQAKINKHGEESKRSQHTFIGAPGTTLGNIHSKDFWALYDLAWTRAAHQARERGTPAHMTERDKQDDLATLHAILARVSTQATIRLSYPDPHLHEDPIHAGGADDSSSDHSERED